VRRYLGRSLLISEKMPFLPVDVGYEVGPIVFILSKNIAKYKDIPYGGRLAEIRN
jgi:hypothetical protein